MTLVDSKLPNSEPPYKFPGGIGGHEKKRNHLFLRDILSIWS